MKRRIIVQREALMRVDELMRHCNPFKQGLWNSGNPTPMMVRQAIKDKRFRNTPHHQMKWNPTLHAERIAYLVIHGWEDFIQYDPERYLLIDGNHRLAAAFMRGDVFIKVDRTYQREHEA